MISVYLLLDCGHSRYKSMVTVFASIFVPQGKRETLNVGKMMEEFHNGALSFTIIPLSRCLTGGSNNMFNQTN